MFSHFRNVSQMKHFFHCLNCFVFYFRTYLTFFGIYLCYVDFCCIFKILSCFSGERKILLSLWKILGVWFDDSKFSFKDFVFHFAGLVQGQWACVFFFIHGFFSSSSINPVWAPLIPLYLWVFTPLLLTATPGFSNPTFTSFSHLLLTLSSCQIESFLPPWPLSSPSPVL